MSNNTLALFVASATIICVCSAALAYWSTGLVRDFVKTVIENNEREILARDNYINELKDTLRRLGK